MGLNDFHVNLLKGDDIKAFKQFFEGFYPTVCIFAQKYLKDIDMAEDIAQEAFIEFWKCSGEFTDIKAVKGFIYAVTRNKCLNHLKIQNIRDHILKNEYSTEEYFCDLIIEEETYRIVHQAVNSLAPQTRNIILLSLEGKKNQEIADHLEVSVNTIKTLKKNAYKELRNRMKDHVFVLFLLYHFLN